MAVKIKLKRLGKVHAPYYRIVVADARVRRDGRAIEEIGKYHPKEDPSLIEVDSERVQHWLRVGAQPTDPVRVLLQKTGDWQQFKGLPAPEPLKVAAPRPDRRAAYEVAAKEALGVEGAKKFAPKNEGGRGGTSDDHAAQAPEQPAVATGTAGSEAPGDATAGA